FPPGRPPFVPDFEPAPSVAALPAGRQLTELARRATRGAPRDRLLYGVALQRLGRSVSAERQFEAAAAAAPGDPQAQVAAPGGRFTKARPAEAFGRLGPLARRFPRAATVRFHLGLMLLWLDEVAPARAQLRLAVADAPASAIGRQARIFLQKLPKR